MTAPSLLDELEEVALLPCPFCGGSAARVHNPFLGDKSMAECVSCGARAYDRKWNRRTHHAEIAEAWKDRARMDWLERNATNITLDGRMHRVMQIGVSRESIDAATQEGKG